MGDIDFFYTISAISRYRCCQERVNLKYPAGYQDFCSDTGTKVPISVLSRKEYHIRRPDIMYDIGTNVSISCVMDMISGMISGFLVPKICPEIMYDIRYDIRYNILVDVVNI